MEPVLKILFFVVAVFAVIGFVKNNMDIFNNKKKKDGEYKKLLKCYHSMRLADACSADNVNFYQDCLARFASKVYGKDIPVYSDGEPWRPGDLVTFRAVLGGNTFNGEVEVNIDDEGMMQDRCPLTVRVLREKDGESERFFEAAQICDVRMIHRPEHFAEEIARQKDKK